MKGRKNIINCVKHIYIYLKLSQMFPNQYTKLYLITLLGFKPPTSRSKVHCGNLTPLFAFTGENTENIGNRVFIRRMVNKAPATDT
jgi:hypothetical protein